jgi:hypothetical protein
MKIYTYDDCEYRSFTYEEEQALAEFVMKLLCQLWVREGFSDVLESIYYKKLQYGFNLRETEWDELVYFLDRYIDNIEEVGIPWPSFYDDDTDIRDTLLDLYDDELTFEIMKTTQLAWREVWLRNDDLHRIADNYRILPKDRIYENDSDYDEQMKFLDNLRKDTIIKVMKENPELTYPEACLYVRDYIPRTPEDLD